MGDATVSSLAAEDGSQAAGLEMLTMEANGLQIVTTKINRAGGHMVLMAGARAPLGVVLVGVKATAADLIKLLAE